MGLFGNKAVAAQNNTPEAKYNAARSNLLLVFAFSLVNLVLSLVGADLYFLFSATFPQVALLFGQLFAAELAMPAFYGVGIGVALVSVGLYALCWLLSKKNFGWMIAATVLFALDCLLLLLFLDVEMIIDIVFHVWVMVTLVSGCINGRKKDDAAQQPDVPAAMGETETPDGAMPYPPVQTVTVNGEPVEMDATYQE